MRILDRYIFKELVPPFAFGVAMFTAIFLGAMVLPNLAKLAIQGASTFEVSWMFALSLPGVVSFTFPMAMLLATLLGMGRLSSESELVAALASGISLRRMAVPVVGTALGVALFCFWFLDRAVPWSQESFNRLKHTIAQRMRGDVEQSLVQLVPDPGEGQGPPRLIVMARGLRLGEGTGKQALERGTLLGVTVVYLNSEGEPEGLAKAGEARYDAERQKWLLLDAKYYQLLPGGDRPLTPKGRSGISPLEVDELGVSVDLGRPPVDLGRDVKPEERTLADLRQAIRELTKNGMPTGALEVQLHQRFAVPFAAVVFAMVGLPLGLRRQRTGSSMGLGLSVLIIFGYYIVWNYLGQLGKGDAMDPFLAAWIPNAIGIGMGAVLLQRAPK
ncbi:MAG: LptF/LptG family permease [Armatimonadetes bacterium]|nr:LptF/LptG family permease [Armatimonadota bacterium]